MGSQTPTKTGSNSHSRVGLIPSFLHCFSPSRTVISVRECQITPWFKAGLGYSCSRGVIPASVCYFNVSARYALYLLVYSGVGNSSEREIPSENSY